MLSFIRHIVEHSWDVIIVVVMTMDPPIGCLGSSCNPGAVILSAERKLET